MGNSIGFCCYDKDILKEARNEIMMIKKQTPSKKCSSAKNVLKAGGDNDDILKQFITKDEEDDKNSLKYSLEPFNFSICDHQSSKRKLNFRSILNGSGKQRFTTFSFDTISGLPSLNPINNVEFTKHYNNVQDDNNITNYGTINSYIQKNDPYLYGLHGLARNLSTTKTLLSEIDKLPRIEEENKNGYNHNKRNFQLVNNLAKNFNQIKINKSHNCSSNRSNINHSSNNEANSSYTGSSMVPMDSEYKNIDNNENNKKLKKKNKLSIRIVQVVASEKCLE